MKKYIELNVPVKLSKDELVENIYEFMSYKELLDFVIKLDKRVEDWDFTERLFKHFLNEMLKLYDEEFPNDVEEKQEFIALLQKSIDEVQGEAANNQL